MKRHELREQIFLILFSLGFHDGEDLRELVLRYLDETCETRISDLQRAEILKKTLEVAGKAPELDKMIDDAAEGWSVSRMGKAELTILRLALYEMLYDPAVPVKVAINEAIELARAYCSDVAPSFVNGILGKLAPQENAQEAEESVSKQADQTESTEGKEN